MADIALSNPEAEKALLTQLIVKPSLVLDVAQQLNPGDIYSPAYQSIFRCLVELSTRGVHPDMVTITERLVADGACGTLSEARQRVMDVTGSTIYTMDINNCIATIRRYAVRRRGLEAAARIIGVCSDESLDEIDAIIDGIESEALSVAQDMGVGGGGVTLSDQWPLTLEWFERSGKEPRPAVSTGFSGLDKLLLGGLKPGNMVVLGARPAVGKTSLAINIADSAIRSGKRVYIAELEMTAHELAVKLGALRANVSAAKGIRGEAYSTSELARIKDAGGLYQTADGVVIDDRPGLTMATIRASARRAMKGVAPGEGLVIIDHIGLIRPAGTPGRQPRYVEVGYSSREIKVMAKELGVPVLVLSQLNRESAKDSRAPRMSDLRECGDIEQDADIVMLIDRLDADAEPMDNRPQPGTADVIVAKARLAETGVVTLAFDGEHGRFSEIFHHSAATSWDDDDYEDIDTSDPHWYEQFDD